MICLSISAANHPSSPPTGSIQPSPQCPHALGFQPAAALSGCRCLVPRARRGWPGSPRRCRDGRCQSAASAGSEMPQPSPGPRRTLALMCTRKRRRVVRCLLGWSDVGHATLAHLTAAFQVVCPVFILPSMKLNSLLLPVMTAALLTHESWYLLSRRVEKWRKSSTPWRGLSLKSHSSVTQVFVFN